MLAAARHAEHQASIRPAYDKARDERARLLAVFNRDYPKHVAAIVGLLEKMRAWDGESVETPQGEARLDSLQSDIRPVLYGLNLPDGRGAYAWGYDIHKQPHAMTQAEQNVAVSRRPGFWR